MEKRREEKRKLDSRREPWERERVCCGTPSLSDGLTTPDFDASLPRCPDRERG